MTKLFDLVRDLNKVLGYEGKSFTPHVTFNPSFNQCSVKYLLEGHLYVYIPNKDLQEKVKENITDFVDEKDLHFVATTHYRCPGNYECYGHRVDLFNPKGHPECVFVDEFPEDINGTSLYFFNQENYKKFEVVRNKE